MNFAIWERCASLRCFVGMGKCAPAFEGGAGHRGRGCLRVARGSCATAVSFPSFSDDDSLSEASDSQLALPLAAPKRGAGTNGGRRSKNAGHANVKHRVRIVAKRWPVHVVIRLRPEIPSLRCASGWNAVRGALATQLRRHDFRICHLSVQRTHVHLLVEVDNAKALSSGMGGFQIALAKRIHAWLGTRGEVFSDRYFATSLRSPTQIRNTLSYILNNWRKHGEDRAERSIGALDPYSSAGMLEEWSEFPS